MSNEKMEVWDAVSRTNPDHTKHVNQRGGFTAIDAHYQIMNATAQFGPIGVGWGYTSGEPIFQGEVVIVPVTLWHGDRSNSFGPVYGCAKMFSGKLDADAPKKAGTDALTKLLSQLGFNADVFLGKFDDNKYVSELKEEFKEKPPEKTDDQKRDAIKSAIGKKNSEVDLETYWADPRLKDGLETLPQPMQAELQKAYSDRMGQVAS